jgi:hypothetical protein
MEVALQQEEISKKLQGSHYWHTPCIAHLAMYEEFYFLLVYLLVDTLILTLAG